MKILKWRFIKDVDYMEMVDKYCEMVSDLANDKVLVESMEESITSCLVKLRKLQGNTHQEKELIREVVNKLKSHVEWEAK